MAGEQPTAEGTEGERGIGRALGALIHPRATFESVANRPTWLLPLVLLMALSVAVTYSYGHRVGWRSFFEQQAARNTRISQMSPAQQQKALEAQVKYAPLLGYLGSTAGLLIVTVIEAGILLGAFNIFFGTKIKFKQAMGLTTHAFMPGVVRGIIGLIVIWVRPPEGIDIQNLVTSNAAAFLPASASNWMKTLGASFDLFTFWMIALLAIGFTAAGTERKLKIGSSLSIIVVLWLFWVTMIVGVTALFS